MTQKPDNEGPTQAKAHGQQTLGLSFANKAGPSLKTDGKKEQQ